MIYQSYNTFLFLIWGLKNKKISKSSGICRELDSYSLLIHIRKIAMMAKAR